MQKTCVVVVWGLITALSVSVLADEKKRAEEMPTSVLIVKETVHSREGIGETNAISVVDPATVAKLAAFFPDYDKRPSSDIADPWIAGYRVYFNLANGRAIRVTVSANGDGDTWSVGNGDFRTKGDFGAFIRSLRRRADRITKTSLQVNKASVLIVDELVAKHLEAIGGAESTMTTNAGLTLKLTITQKAPNLSQVRIDVPSLGVIMEYPRQSPNWLKKLLHDSADVLRIVGVSGASYVNWPSSDPLFGPQSRFGDASLKHLKGLSSLELLEISRTKVTDAGLEHLKGLTNLKELNINGTRVTDAGLEHLKGLTNLQRLDLYSTRVTDAGLEHLKGLPRLKSLVLGSKITDAGLEHLNGLSSLEELDLIGSQVADAGLEHLKGMTNLQRLYLYDTQVTGEGFKYLQGLTSLGSLDLNGPQITDASLEYLKLLTNLQRLDINQTQITGEGAKKLRQALPDCMVAH